MTGVSKVPTQMQQLHSNCTSDRQKAGGIVPTSVFRRKGKKGRTTMSVFAGIFSGFCCMNG
jgi:hypothetical protein